jgi:hypothetical protein
MNKLDFVKLKFHLCKVIAEIMKGQPWTGRRKLEKSHNYRKLITQIASKINNMKTTMTRQKAKARNRPPHQRK